MLSKLLQLTSAQPRALTTVARDISVCCAKTGKPAKSFISTTHSLLPMARQKKDPQDKVYIYSRGNAQYVSRALSTSQNGRRILAPEVLVNLRSSFFEQNALPAVKDFDTCHDPYSR